MLSKTWSGSTLAMVHAVCASPHFLVCMQSVSSGVCYIIAQCLGGIFGAAGAFYSLPGQSPFCLLVILAKELCAASVQHMRCVTHVCLQLLVVYHAPSLWSCWFSAVSILQRHAHQSLLQVTSLCGVSDMHICH